MITLLRDAGFQHATHIDTGGKTVLPRKGLTDSALQLNGGSRLNVGTHRDCAQPLQ
jgi:hypothetical protein